MRWTAAFRRGNSAGWLAALGLGVLLLTTWTRGPARGRQKDEPPSAQLARGAFQLALEKRRGELMALEKKVAELRESFRVFNEDLVVYQEIETAKAAADYQNAEKKREVAEVTIREYEEATFPLELKEAERAVRLAEAKLAAAKRQFEESEKPNDQITMLQAQRDAAEASWEVERLTKFTKERRLIELRCQAEMAQADELAKQQMWKFAKRREDYLRQRLKEFKVQAPEEYVLALMDKALDLEDQIIAKAREAKQLAGETKEDPDEAKALADRLQAKRRGMARLAAEAERKFTEALDLAKQVKARRFVLYEAESELRKERAHLQAMEDLAAKP